MPLLLEIVTPEGSVYRETIDTVVLPTTLGEVGILPGHRPLVCELEAGELRVTRGGQETLLAVGRGFVEVDADEVSVLAESAIEADRVDEAAAEEAVRKARERLEGAAALSPEESEQLESLMRFASAQVLVKQKRRR